MCAKFAHNVPIHRLSFGPDSFSLNFRSKMPTFSAPKAVVSRAYHGIQVASWNHPPVLQLPDLLLRGHPDVLNAGQRTEGRQLIASLQLRQSGCHDDEVYIAMLLSLAPGYRAEKDDAFNFNIIIKSALFQPGQIAPYHFFKHILSLVFQPYRGILHCFSIEAALSTIAMRNPIWSLERARSRVTSGLFLRSESDHSHQ
jgi:hypothetical protein